MGENAKEVRDDYAASFISLAVRWLIQASTKAWTDADPKYVNRPHGQRYSLL